MANRSQPPYPHPKNILSPSRSLPDSPFWPQWSPLPAERSHQASVEGEESKYFAARSSPSAQSAFQTIQIPTAPTIAEPTAAIMRNTQKKPPRNSRTATSSRTHSDSEYRKDRDSLRERCHSFHLDPFAVTGGEAWLTGGNHVHQPISPAGHQQVPHLHYFWVTPESTPANAQGALEDSESDSSDEEGSSPAPFRRSESPDFPHVSTWHHNTTRQSRREMPSASTPPFHSQIASIQVQSPQFPTSSPPEFISDDSLQPSIAASLDMVSPTPAQSFRRSRIQSPVMEDVSDMSYQGSSMPPTNSQERYAYSRSPSLSTTPR